MRFGKKKTKIFFQQKFSRGSLIFGGLKKISSPPPLNNEPSFRDLSLFTGRGAGDFEGPLILASRQGGHLFLRQMFLKPENFPGGSLIFGGLEKNLNYGQGAGDFEGGPLILASRQWEVLIFGAKFYVFREKIRLHYLHYLWVGGTAYRRGALFWRPRK